MVSISPVWTFGRRARSSKTFHFRCFSSDNAGAFHFENAFVRFDNLFGSGWLNLKVGKFELTI